MYKAVALGALRVSLPLAEAVPLVAEHGIMGLVVNMKEIQAVGVAEAQERFSRYGVRPAAFGFPVNFREDEETFRDSLEALPALAETARQLGCLRTATYLLPFHEELTYKENFSRHRRRLEAAAQVLDEYGIRLGLEFVAPETSREGRRYSFIHDMDGVLSLIDAMDASNVGVLLDAWHWYIAGHDVDDILALDDEKRVVLVHVNDAPAGIPRSQQQDLVRCLPGETGVIDIKAFLQALAELGYKGPVVPEPFSAQLRGVTPHEALALTAGAMETIWQQAELA